jgi:hypothetical protein
MQSQEALKIIHDMPIEPGKVTHFNGLTNVMHTTAYVPREECESHWTYGEVTELPARAERTTLQDLIRIARSDLGEHAIIELDQELVTSLECPNCHTMEQVLQPMSAITFEAGHCPTCGILRDAQFTHVITGEENFLHRTLSSVGVPALHILRAQNGVEYRFYELTGDLPEALHFRHFERNGPEEPLKFKERIRLKSVVPASSAGSASPAQSRIRLKDEASKNITLVKPASGKIKLKNNKKKEKVSSDKTLDKASEPVASRIRYKGAEIPLRIKTEIARGRIKVCKI